MTNFVAPPSFKISCKVKLYNLKIDLDGIDSHNNFCEYINP